MVRVKRLLLLCLWMVLALPWSLPGLADTLTADFAQGAPAGWRLPATAAVADGALAFSGPGLAYWNEASVADFTLTLRYLHGKGTADIVMRARPQTGTGYHLRFGQSQVSMTRQSGKSSVPLGAVDLVLAANWYPVTVEAKGGRISVAMDGKAVLEVVDPQPLGRGVIGLGAAQGGVSYSEAVVVRPEEGAPSPAAPRPATGAGAGDPAATPPRDRHRGHPPKPRPLHRAFAPAGGQQRVDGGRHLRVRPGDPEHVLRDARY